MKKYLLALILCFVLVVCAGCNKKNNSNETQCNHNFVNGICELCQEENPKELELIAAKEVYDNLMLAYLACPVISSGVYAAWYFAVYDATDCAATSSVSEFSKAIGVKSSVVEPLVNKKALELGFDTHAIGQWATLRRENAAVDVVLMIYEQTGMFTETEKYLDNAKNNLKKLTSEYQYDTHLSDLQSLYSVVLSYYKSSVYPSGTLNGFRTAVSNYEQEVKTYKNKLSIYYE